MSIAQMGTIGQTYREYLTSVPTTFATVSTARVRFTSYAQQM